MNHSSFTNEQQRRIAHHSVSEHAVGRRSFLKGLVAGAIIPARAIAGETTPAGRASSEERKPLVGIQIAPFNLLDEGIEACLDRVSEYAAVNTLFMYTHTYYGIPYSRTANVLAPDHGVAPRNDLDRRFCPVWVRHDRKNFGDTKLWFEAPNPDVEHHGRDVFAEVREPARQRGIKVYGRILEPGLSEIKGQIRHWEQVTSIDIYGRLANQPCRNHPELRAWWAALMTDLFRNYELDGYQWGAERSGPLAEVLYRGLAPACFCQHCIARAKKAGIDPELARQGFTELHRLIRSALDGKPAPPGGVMHHALGLLLKYPEIIAWERQWRLAVEELSELVYTSIKKVRPDAEVGRHIDSQGTTLNPITRAGTDYADIAAHADFIKPILYQDVMAPRLKSAIETWVSGTLTGLPAKSALSLMKALNGYDDATVPRIDELESKSLSPRYVFTETERIVLSVNGEAAVYPGIGLDVPHRRGREFERTAQAAEDLYRSVLCAFEAGAGGVVASREYDEMRIPTLKAFGQAVRHWKGDD